MSRLTFRRFFSDETNSEFKRYRIIDERTGNRHKTIFSHHHFIAWDGEGIDLPDGKQVYALFMNNEGKKIMNPKGLSTLDCLDLLINASDDNKAIHVCFGASYDVNMILRDIPKPLLKKLHNGEYIDYGLYRLEYVPRKCFIVRLSDADRTKQWVQDKKGKYHRVFIKSVVLWDVFGFFGISFVEAIKSYMISGNNVTTEREKYEKIVAKIQEGKLRRGTFTRKELEDFVEPYCKLEVDMLCELMNKLHYYMQEIGMKVTRWDGAGACAAALMKQYGVKPHITEQYMTPDIINACTHAFFGGRIETIKYGNYSNRGQKEKKEYKIYHYDINSAYPHALRLLNSMLGRWKYRVVNQEYELFEKPQNKYIALISWECEPDIPVTPFLWRDNNGLVLTPLVGKSWVWCYEIEAAAEVMLDKVNIFVHEIYEYIPQDKNFRPFAFVEELFEKRKQLKKEKNGAEKVIKLGMNSLYGKTIQSLGYSEVEIEEQVYIRKPPFHNIAIAGQITSITRASLLKACKNHLEAIISFATDGIYSLEPLDENIKLGSGLGEWEFTLHCGMTIVQSGVYWLDTEKNGMIEESSYHRGFDESTVTRDKVIEAWDKGITSIFSPSRRFVTLGAALAAKDFSIWCTWRTIERELKLVMDKATKRVSDEDDTTNPATGLHKTKTIIDEKMKDYMQQYPFYNDEMLSRPYSFKWSGMETILIDNMYGLEYLRDYDNTNA